MGQDIPVFAIGLLFGAALLLRGAGDRGSGSVVGQSGTRLGRTPSMRRCITCWKACSRAPTGWRAWFRGAEMRWATWKINAVEAHQGQDAERHGTACAVFDAMMQTNEQVRKRLEVAEETLQRQANEITAYMSEARTDTLTGLPNRRALDSELTRRVAESRDGAGPLSLMLIDIDHFKRLNDRHGHPAGDAVLAEVGRVLMETVREPQFVARLGGEEFAVVLPDCSGSDATHTAERVRLAIARHGVHFERALLRITISYGVAQLQSGEQASSLLKRSDQALYASKGAGRNCGHLHDGTRCIPVAPPPTLEGNGEQPPREFHTPLLECDDFRQVCQDVRKRLLSLVERER